MKITKAQLKQIIKEEISSLIETYESKMSCEMKGGTWHRKTGDGPGEGECSFGDVAARPHLEEDNGDPSKKPHPAEEAEWEAMKDEPPLKEQDEKRYTLTLEWLEVMLKNHAALLGASDPEKIAKAAARIVRDVRRNHYAPNPRDETPWAPGGPGAYPAGP